MADQTSLQPKARLLVDIPAAAEMLSVAPEVVQRMIDEGTLVPMKVGGQVRLGVAVLHAWVDEQMILSFSGESTRAYQAIEELARDRRVAMKPVEPVDPAIDDEAVELPVQAITAAHEERTGYL